MIICNYNEIEIWNLPFLRNHRYNMVSKGSGSYKVRLLRCVMKNKGLLKVFSVISHSISLSK